MSTNLSKTHGFT